MPIIELPQPATPNALLTFNGGAQTLGLTSGMVGAPRVAIATGTDLASTLTEGVVWWLPGVSGSPWLLGYGRFDVTGGTGHDNLGPGILGPQDDSIRGGAGDDTIAGAAAGQDFLDGGPGQDMLAWSWTGLSTPSSVQMAQAMGSMTVGGTTFSGFERFALTLGDGPDIIDARGFQGAGSSSFAGGAGDDLFLADHTTNHVRFVDGPGTDTLRLDLSALTIPVEFVVPRVYYGSGERYTGPAGFRFEDSMVAVGNQALIVFGRGFLRYDVTDVPEIIELDLGSGSDHVRLSGMVGNLHSASIDGGAGNDTLEGGPWLVGGDGDDMLSGGMGHDTIDGGPGIDTIAILVRGDAAFRLNADSPQQTRAGSDLVRGVENVQVMEDWTSNVGAWVIGDAGANHLSITITSAAVRFEGMGGDDTLLGGGGHDQLFGGDGHDSLAGDAGANLLDGGAGHDTLTGGTGHDTLIGGSGTNSAAGGTGHDILVIGGARHGGSLTITPDAPISNGLSGASASIQGSYTGGRETTAFTGIETLTFTDGRLAFDPGDVAFQVSRLYQVAFNRAPDPYGLNFWIDQLHGGTTLAAVAGGFARSGEFGGLYGGMDNTGFVTALYQNMLGRAPDAPGLAFWTGNLANGAGRDSVLLGFSESPEFRGLHLAANITGIWDQDGGAAAIARLYQATLNRRPEEAGLRDWRAEMAAGKSLADLVPGFTNSAEFTALYGATSNQAFVTLLYNNVLGRAPDAAGFAGWVAQLDAGGSRTDVVLGFSESLEFRLSTMAWIEGGVVFA